MQNDQNLAEQFDAVFQPTSRRAETAEALCKGLDELQSTIETLRKHADALMAKAQARYDACEDINLALDELDEQGCSASDPLGKASELIKLYRAHCLAMTRIQKQRSLRVVLKLLLAAMHEL